MPAYPADPASSNLAERRYKDPPAPIHISSNHVVAKTPKRSLRETIPETVSPLSPTKAGNGMHPDTDASSYSPDKHSMHPGPLNIRENTFDHTRSDVNDAVLDMYKGWTKMQSPGDLPLDGSPNYKMSHRPRRSKSTGEGLRSRHEAISVSPTTPPPFPPHPHPHPVQASIYAAASAQRDMDSPLFSPLAFYFRGPDFPTTKKGEKTMIGQNGWLERTEKSPDKGKKAPQKKVGILDSIKKIAKDMVSLKPAVPVRLTKLIL